MDKAKLVKHIKLCSKNLRSSRAKCCASCPFEEEITDEYPGFDLLFTRKRQQLAMEESDG